VFPQIVTTCPGKDEETEEEQKKKKTGLGWFVQLNIRWIVN
jgi:hypothetical protein